MESKSAALGAVLVVGMRWTDRLIGLISTMVLARLLVPADFGVIAMASLVMGLVDVLTDLGVNIALVHNKNATQQDFNTAWTLRLIQYAITAVLVFSAAHPAAIYFNDPRVAAVTEVLALAVLIQGFENIGIVSFQKNMHFGQDFIYFVGKRLVGFTVTIVCAWMLGTYWAMVFGTLAARTMGVLLSYYMHEMRPRLSLVGLRGLLAFSSWNVVRGIGGYLSENMHRVLVGGRESSSTMGTYSLASDISAMPSSELLVPLNRVLFPVFVDARDDPVRFRRTFMMAMGIQAMVGVPAGVALALLAPEIVLSLLGQRWADAIPFVRIMGAINIMGALTVSGSFLLLALGRAKLTAVHAWGQAIFFLLLAVVLFPAGGAMAIAKFRLISAGVGLIIMWILVQRERPEWRLLDLVANVWRPILATGLVALILMAWPASHLPMLALLLMKSTLFITAYSAILLALWHMAGRPDGAEAIVLSKLGNLTKRLRRKAA